MATTYETAGGFAIQFIDGNGARRTVRLGKMTRKAAATVAVHIEALASARIGGAAPPRETAIWLAGLGDVLRDRIARVGLCEPRTVATLQRFADEFPDSRVDWSRSTRAQFRLAMNDAVAEFGADRRLDTIRPADGDRLRAKLGARLSVATARKRCRYVKQLLAHAVRLGVIERNPLADLVTANVNDRGRLRYIPAGDVLRVADGLSGEPRLLLLLARFAGLRIPSEPYALTWDCVDFGSETIRVYAPKTNRTRTIPMTAIVRDALTAQFATAPTGEPRVFLRSFVVPYVRRLTEAAIHRAGLEPWPKLYHNLRASFATDCARYLPANAATAILGHARAVAAEHYWTTDASDFRALHNALQQAAESTRIDAHGKIDDDRKPRKFTNETALERKGGKSKVGDAGFEPATSCVSSRRSSQLS